MRIRWTVVAVALAALAGAPALRAQTDLVLDSFTVSKPHLTVFEPMQTTVTVRNQGPVALTDVGVRLEIDGQPWSDGKLDLPASGGTGTLSWTLSFSPGHHTLWMYVDPDGKVAETDESNNKDMRMVFVERLEVPADTARTLIGRVNATVFQPGEPPATYTAIRTVFADLVPREEEAFGSEPDLIHFGVELRNAGPDAVPPEILQLVTVTVQFIGAPTDAVCTVSAAGAGSGPLAPSQSLKLDVYTDSIAPCPRALLPKKEPQGPGLQFPQADWPPSRLEVDVAPMPPRVLEAGLGFHDPKPYNDVWLVNSP